MKGPALNIDTASFTIEILTQSVASSEIEMAIGEWRKHSPIKTA
jgi:hypothetical protein